MQLPDEYRRLLKAGKAGQPGPVTGLALLTAEHAHLPGSIVELHNMAAALERGRRAAEVVFNKMIATAAELQVERRCIQQEQVAAFHRADNTIIAHGLIYAPVNKHPHLADRAPPLFNLASRADLMTDHLVNDPTFVIVLRPRRIILAVFFTALQKHISGEPSP